MLYIVVGDSYVRPESSTACVKKQPGREAQQRTVRIETLNSFLALNPAIGGFTISP